MDPTKTGQAYDQIAEKWNNDTFNRENGIAQHERAIAFVKNKGLALDVGCGSSGRFIDLLQSNGFDVEGIDVSGKMIEMARHRHPKITFYHADICRWELPAQYDFITAWDSIWHVPLSQNELVLRKLLSGLTPGGVCIFTTGGLDGPEEKIDTNMGPGIYYSVLGIPKTLELLAKCNCICRHLEYDQHPELHLYIIAQKSLK
jgi:SAM-dependent methyltransferase